MEITLKNKFFKEAINLKNSKKFRNKQNQFLIEGVRLCEEAIKNNVYIKTFFYTLQAKEKYPKSYNSLLKRSQKSYIVTNKMFNYLSDTKTPQGIACVCSMLDKKTDIDIIKNMSKVVALENIQDPSNLGTVLRTADALNIDMVVLSKDCCDIYSPKVLRGSMGAVFRIPFFIAQDFVNMLDKVSKLGFKTYAAVVNTKAVPITKVCFSEKTVVAIGNEGNGLTAESIEKCSLKITIPMNKVAESLNASAAANIIIWEMTCKKGV